MKNIIFVFSLIILAMCISSTAIGQQKVGVINQLDQFNTGDNLYLVLWDGSILFGIYQERTINDVTINSNIGVITIEFTKIKEVLLEHPNKAKEREELTNPNQSRLLLAPTGRMLRGGKGYVADVWIFFPSVGVGITDNITMGAGMSLFPGVSFEDQLWYLTPKIGLKATDNFSAALAAFIVKVPETLDDSENNNFFGLLFAMGTIGNVDYSATGGLGFGFIDDELADRPAVILGGQAKIIDHIGFITENWVLPGVDDVIISGGFRFYGESIAVDLALFSVLNALDDSDFPFLPYLDFAIYF